MSIKKTSTDDLIQELNRRNASFETVENGITKWINTKGQLHRIDGPSFIDDKGEHWHLNGKRHRIDGPAVEYTNGDKQWWVDGKLHRTDGPAVICKNEIEKKWYINGKLHREDGPAVIEFDGYKHWYQNGERHREDGPAIEYYGPVIGFGFVDKEWYLNGERHRTDGPAIEWKDGTKDWYLNGEKLTEEEHKVKTKP